jgi:uncharacterized protein
MLNGPKGGLDRRNFMILALGSVGAAAASVNADAAMAQDAAVSSRFVEGTMNVLKYHRIIVGPMGRTGRDTNIFIANSGHTILATHGGFVEILVKLNEKVEVGQKVAIQRNTFGELVAEYSSEVAGGVAGYRTDATAERGTPLVFFFYNAMPQENPVDYAE